MSAAGTGVRASPETSFSRAVMRQDGDGRLHRRADVLRGGGCSCVRTQAQPGRSRSPPRRRACLVGGFALKDRGHAAAVTGEPRRCNTQVGLCSVTMSTRDGRRVQRHQPARAGLYADQQQRLGALPFNPTSGAARSTGGLAFSASTRTTRSTPSRPARPRGRRTDGEGRLREAPGVPPTVTRYVIRRSTAQHGHHHAGTAACGPPAPTARSRRRRIGLTVAALHRTSATACSSSRLAHRRRRSARPRRPTRVRGSWPRRAAQARSSFYVRPPDYNHDAAIAPRATRSRLGSEGTATTGAGSEWRSFDPTSAALLVDDRTTRPSGRGARDLRVHHRDRCSWGGGGHRRTGCSTCAGRLVHGGRNYRRALTPTGPRPRVTTPDTRHGRARVSPGTASDAHGRAWRSTTKRPARHHAPSPPSPHPVSATVRPSRCSGRRDLLCRVRT